MKITTIQIYEDTRKMLAQKKKAGESFDTVIRRMLELEDVPSMEEMFREADKIKQERVYSTGEVVRMIRKLREGG